MARIGHHGFTLLLTLKLLLIGVGRARAACDPCDCYPSLTKPTFMICQGWYADRWPPALAPYEKQFMEEIFLTETLISCPPAMQPGEYPSLIHFGEKNNALLNCSCLLSWKDGVPEEGFDSECVWPQPTVTPTTAADKASSSSSTTEVGDDKVSSTSATSTTTSAASSAASTTSTSATSTSATSTTSTELDDGDGTSGPGARGTEGEGGCCGSSIGAEVDPPITTPPNPPQHPPSTLPPNSVCPSAEPAGPGKKAYWIGAVATFLPMAGLILLLGGVKACCARCKKRRLIREDEMPMRVVRNPIYCDPSADLEWDALVDRQPGSVLALANQPGQPAGPAGASQC